MLEHVGAKMDVAAENFVRAFAGINDLVARVAHRAAQEKLRNPVTVAEKSLRMPDCIREMIRDIGLLDRDGMKVGASPSCHLASDIAFVVGGLIEGEGKRLDRQAGHPRGETQHGAGIEAAAQVTGNRHVCAHSQPNGLFEYRGEFFDTGAFIACVHPSSAAGG
jgi:hypothetical protein